MKTAFIYRGDHENPLTREACDGYAMLVGPAGAEAPSFERFPGMCHRCVAVGVPMAFDVTVTLDEVSRP